MRRLGFSIAALLPCLIVCGGLVDTVTPYDPPAVFEGYINGVYHRLTGNPTWRNTCRLVGDTIRMYLYSTKFSQENTIRSGDQIRLDIMPGTYDTIIELGSVLFHLARYQNTNRSYYIVPADTSAEYKYFKMRIVSFSRQEGDTMEFDNAVIRTPVLPGTYGENLEIHDARIVATIESGLF